MIGVRALDDHVTYHMGGLTLADPTPEILAKHGIEPDMAHKGPIVVRVDARARSLGLSEVHEGDWFAEAGLLRQFRHGSVKALKSYVGQWKACSTNLIPVVYVHGPRSRLPGQRMEGLMLTNVDWIPFRPSFAPQWIPEGVFVIATLAVQVAIALGLYLLRRKEARRPRLLDLWVGGLMTILLVGELAALSVLRMDYALL